MQALLADRDFLRFALDMRPDLTAARLLLASTQVEAADPSATPTPSDAERAGRRCSQ